MKKILIVEDEEADLKPYELPKFATSKPEAIPLSKSTAGSIGLHILVPLLIVLCVSCGIGAKLQKVQNLQYKESNRIKALQQELKAFSEINLQENDIIVVPRQTKFPNTYFFSSYDDHRIAMCLMLLDQQIQDIHIDNVECVQKSYPNFWEEYKKMK